MSKDSTFGSDPERLKRLLSVGIETQPPGQTETGVDPLELLLEKPGVQIGRYELVKVLGEGGMGIVYLAQQREPIRRQVALKIIKLGMDSRRVIARFETEQQTLAIMEHPHIARVYDGGLTASGRPYFVMEYVNGLPITDYCDERRLSIPERLALFSHVCEAVQHAHQKGIIHRDLKPSNILVAERDTRAVPKVIDFGVARALTRPLAELTLTMESGHLVGTPAYMSPEQANIGNPDVDIRSDVYSLGVILYKLLCGLLRVDVGTLKEGGVDEFRRILAEYDPVAPSAALKTIPPSTLAELARVRATDGRSLRRTLSADLDWITLKAIEKDRNRRYPTVDALASDIHRYLNCEPISAAPPSLWYRTIKCLRRHRVAVEVALVLVLLIAGGTLTLSMYKTAADAEQYAETVKHQQILSEARDLFGDRQYEAVQSSVSPFLRSRHVGRAARLLHARTTLELEGPIAAIGELETVLGPADDTAGQAHFLLAKIYDDLAITDANQATQFQHKREYHQRAAEHLVPAIARYYFLRRQILLTTSDQLNLLRSSLRLHPNGIFGQPVNLGPVINSSAAEWSPSISADDRQIYFVSDRAGGPGGWDIWTATRTTTDDEWSIPVNVGPPVNTSGPEWFPSISGDGLELYFCRGDWGQGDLYVAIRREPRGPWETVTRLPDAINVSADDYSPLISFDGHELYFISKRAGGPGDIDIWLTKRSAFDLEWGCPEPLPRPINSVHKEGHKCLSSDGLILFFQRIKGNEANKFLYATIRETKTDAWSLPVNLGPMPVPDPSLPAISSLSHDGTKLYFFDHPFRDPQPGGFGQQDIWYLPITPSPDGTASTLNGRRSYDVTQP